MGRRGLERLEEEGAIQMVEEFQSAETHRSNRVPMIGILKGHESRLFTFIRPLMLPILKGHLERHLDRRRSIVGIKDTL
jgi:hypothetical protein